MKKKKIDLSWKVYFNNNGTIDTLDIFEYGCGMFVEFLKSSVKKHRDLATGEIDKDAVIDEFRDELIYLFYCKYEWETVVTSWLTRISSDELKRLNDERESTYTDFSRSIPIRPLVSLKIDVYKQLELNWDRFAEYVKDNLDNI